jgi:hypothetical protein
VRPADIGCDHTGWVSPPSKIDIIRREDAEWLIEEVRADDPEVAAKLGSKSGS